jgi:hypothetical protein
MHYRWRRVARPREFAAQISESHCQTLIPLTLLSNPAAVILRGSYTQEAGHDVYSIANNSFIAPLLLGAETALIFCARSG